jgi:hypothetical protein
MMGAGVKPGFSYGSSEEFGFQTAEKNLGLRFQRHDSRLARARPRAPVLLQQWPRTPPHQRSRSCRQGRSRLTALAPRNSPGTLNAGSTTWESGAVFEWEVNDAAGIVSTHWNLLNITGGLTITATSNLFSINLVSLTAADAAGQVPNCDANADATWTFVTASGGITFDGERASIRASFALNTSGFQNTPNGPFGIAQDGNDLNITYTASAVPEPRSFAAWLGLSIPGFCAHRPRRVRRSS